MAASAPVDDHIPAGGWRIVLLASLGGTLEFYDFVIFGVFARDIAQAIFPATSPIVSLMASFAAFAVGYVARPLGGIVLSHYGDRFGRRRVFLWSIFVMSGATLGMGLVPDYAQWGAAASALMVTLRLVQGFCLGGELPGAITYVVETAPRAASLVCGLVFACVTMGVAVATGVSLSIRTWLDPSVVTRYGWRIAFILGGLGGVLSFLLRRSLEESAEFAHMRALAVRQPFREVMRTHGAQVAVGAAFLAGTACFNGLFFSHLPAYLVGVLQYDQRHAVFSQTAGVVANAAATVWAGWLGSRVASRYLLRLGVGLLLLLAYPFYLALETRALNLTLLLSLAGVVAGFTNGSFASLLAGLFPTRIRFTGVALVFNISFTLFSGTAPLVATTMIRDFGMVTAPAFLMIACAALALIGSFWIGRYAGHMSAVVTSRRAGTAALLLLLLTVTPLWAPSLGAQQRPRTPDGHPDLQGLWLNNTATPLERPREFGDRATFTDEEAREYLTHYQLDRTVAISRDKAFELDAAGDLDTYEPGPVMPGGRNSLITDPPSGTLPALTPEAQRRVAERAQYLNGHYADNPEDLTNAERCLVVGSSSVPPLLPSFYNNATQIVQTRDYVIIHSEMIHDARVIPLNRSAHLPASIREWKGDSIGRWDGETLVVDTTNFTSKTPFRGASSELHLVERFSLDGAGALRYQFTVEDPAFVRSWSAESRMTRTDEAMFEYACHEGNQSLPIILSGRRFGERNTGR